jgi:hypothetical protein
MPDTKLYNLTTLGVGGIADGDYMELLDVSDNAMGAGAPPGTNKKVLVSTLRSKILAGVYVAGGTEVAVADGGTGASDAATALANLGAANDTAVIHNALGTAKGDVIGYSASGTPVRVPKGSQNGKVLATDSAASPGVSYIHQFAKTTHAARLAAGPSGLTQLILETDTGQAYLDALGSHLIWPGVGMLGKTADETVTSSTTLQDDDALTFPVEASEIWQFEGAVVFTMANATMDLKWTIAGPTSPTTALFWRRPLEYPAPGVGAVPATPTQAFAAAQTQGGGANATIGIVVEFAGYIVNGSNAGNVRLQWAQNTSDAGALKALKGSWIKPSRIA